MTNIILLAADTTKSGAGTMALYALVGFLGVCLIIAFLVGMLYLSRVIFAQLDKRKAEKEAQNAANALSDTASDSNSALDDDELVAVITAAISAILESEQSDNKIVDENGETLVMPSAPPFVVRSITSI